MPFIRVLKMQKIVELLIVLIVSMAFTFQGQEKPDGKADIFLQKGIREIFLEVKTAALVTPEGLREWQSFLGKDEDDTYKDDHLFIIIQETGRESRIWIQVTKLERHPENPRWQSGLAAKIVAAKISGDDVAIGRNDFSSEEISGLIPEIIRSIKEKKKLLGIKSF